MHNCNSAGIWQLYNSALGYLPLWLQMSQSWWVLFSDNGRWLGAEQPHFDLSGVERERAMLKSFTTVKFQRWKFLSELTIPCNKTRTRKQRQKKKKKKKRTASTHDRPNQTAQKHRLHNSPTQTLTAAVLTNTFCSCHYKLCALVNSEQEQSPTDQAISACTFKPKLQESQIKTFHHCSRLTMGQATEIVWQNIWNY